MIKRILGLEGRNPERARQALVHSHAQRELEAETHAHSLPQPREEIPARTFQIASEDDSANNQMKQLAREWIVSALKSPKSMYHIAVQFRHIVEGFWPFNDPSKMNIPHPEFMDVVAEVMQTILVKCEMQSEGHACVAAQPHSLLHFCNFLLLLAYFISEFASLAFDIPEFLVNIAFRACNLCLKSPLQLPMAQAFLGVWMKVGCELENRLTDFPDLVDAVRDAVLYGTSSPAARADPKKLLVEALELRARRWRAAAAAAAAPAKAGDGDWAGTGDAGGSALADALARATVRLGASGDWAPPPAVAPRDPAVARVRF